MARRRADAREQLPRRGPGPRRPDRLGLGIGDIRSIVDCRACSMSSSPTPTTTGTTWAATPRSPRSRSTSWAPTTSARGRCASPRRTWATTTRLERFGAVPDLDRRFFDFLSDETTPRPLPPGFDPAAWKIAPCVPSRLLRDGDVLDLGDGRSRSRTPGHAGLRLLRGRRERHAVRRRHVQHGRDLRAAAGLGPRGLRHLLASPRWREIRSVYMAARATGTGASSRRSRDGFAAIVAGNVDWEDEHGSPVRSREAC